MRTSLLRFLTLTAAIGLLPMTVLAAAAKPNIIIVMPDDMDSPATFRK